MTSVANRAFGAQSMTAPLREVLVKRARAGVRAGVRRPGARLPAPGRPRRRAPRARRPVVDASTGSGSAVHVLDTETDDDPDLVYTFDPLLVTDRGAIPLRPGKPNRAGEPAVLEAWTLAAGIPTLGRIEAPGTVEGGDTFWLRPDLFCIGRTLRTNDAGARQLGSIVGGDVRVFDVPYWKGPGRAHPPAVGHLAGRRRPRGRLPAAAAGRAVGAARRPRHPAGRGARGGVPDARLQRPRGPARGRDRRRGQPRHAARRSRRPAARSTRIPLREIGRERLRRPDLPDPADPARLTPAGDCAGAGSAPMPVDAAALRRDLEALVRIPSVTGDEDAIAADLADAAARRSASTVEVVPPRPGGDPRRPGLAGRGDAAHDAAGRDRPGRAARAGAGSSCRATSTSCRPAIRRPGRSTRGRPRSATAGCTDAAPAT